MDYEPYRVYGVWPLCVKQRQIYVYNLSICLWHIASFICNGCWGLGSASDSLNEENIRTRLSEMNIVQMCMYIIRKSDEKEMNDEIENGMKCC